jgi:transcriptional regulator CtsR
MAESKMPAWLEKIIVEGIKKFVPASAVASYITMAKMALVDRVNALAASTENEIDDAIAQRLSDAIIACEVDCELIEKGEVAVVAMLRKAVETTATEIDDAIVDILEQALKDS